MMRAALWFVGLFALAVALALFAGNNQGMVSLFWPPYRVDISLNMALLALLGLFVLCYASLRGVAVLGQLPEQTRRWRQQQKERKLYAALIRSLAHLQAGRFVRASKSARELLEHSNSLRHSNAAVPLDSSLRSIAHLLAADSAHALQDPSVRDQHYAQLLEDTSHQPSPLAQEVREGAQMRAARWALDDRNPQESLQRLAQLPQGAARRTLALRIKLKAARLAQDNATALETTRLLAKHGGFTPASASSLIASLVGEEIRACHDTQQLEKLWRSLPTAEQHHPDIALPAVRQWIDLAGDAAQARQWLLPLWEAYIHGQLPTYQAQRLFLALQHSLENLDGAWLKRIEQAQTHYPKEALLQYLGGMACLQRQLWGKAEQLLRQSLPRLQDTALQASCWRALAILAEQRNDPAAATTAWRAAALARD